MEQQLIPLQTFVKFTEQYTPKRMSFPTYKYYLAKQQRKYVQSISFILAEGSSHVQLK